MATRAVASFALAMLFAWLFWRIVNDCFAEPLPRQCIPSTPLGTPPPP